MKSIFFVSAAIPILALLIPNVYAGEDERDTNPYCDLISDEDPRSQPCHDRKDFSDTTGLYTCNDFSHVQDWQDCPDVSGYDYDGYKTQNTNFFPEEGTEEFNDIKDCADDGYDDGLNIPFSRDRYEECHFDYLTVNPYYDAFINGCLSVEGNTKEICGRNID